MRKIFAKAADKISRILGDPLTFIITCIIIKIWLFIYWKSNWNDTVNLVANIVISIFTLLTLLILQNTQNRNDKATHLKLDEIIHSLKEARDEFIKAEEDDEEEIKRLEEEINKYKNRPAD